VEAAQRECAWTKAALKTPQSKRWRAGQNPRDGDTFGSRNGFCRPGAGLPPSLRFGATSRSGRSAATATEDGEAGLRAAGGGRQLGGIGRCRLMGSSCFSIHEAILPQVLKFACCRAT